HPTADADAQIAVKAAEGEKKIAEIRAGALEAVQAVAADTAAEIVAAMSGKADEKAIGSAVADRMKG
ncbi:MAG: F0F1 ATP synthase subunit B', partial [Lutimaribacter sp.]